LKRTPILIALLMYAAALLLGCGNNYSNLTKGSTGPVPHRALVAQDISAGSAAASLQIVNADTDIKQLVGAMAPSSSWSPKKMVVTPNRNSTVVFSSLNPSDHSLFVANNLKSTVGAAIVLPGMTQSFVVSPDSTTVYAAVPTAPVTGQSPGAVAVISLGANAITAVIDIPAVQFLAVGSLGNRILGFSANSDSVAVITPSNIGTSQPVVTFVGGFDRPVWAYFSNGDNTAYVVNCGAECGGLQASVQALDLTTSPPTPGAAYNVPAATEALVNGSTMYLAGTPVPASPCTGKTQATTCGLLTTFDIPSMSVVGTPAAITDGYHDRFAMGANGQLFVGANTCTELTGTEVRGCLSVFNTLTGAVVVPPDSGDVTGIQPIATRLVVYVVQGGELQIYDTSTDTLQATQVDINGDATDVKTVDE